MKKLLLNKKEIAKAIKKLPDWSTNPKETAITHTRTFKNHIDALVFIARVTVHAQVLLHHPEILFTYSKVRITLTTHDAKGLTAKDFELANKIALLT
jgi:4a-hydroxytetrahydrobiopterin dehydratase